VLEIFPTAVLDTSILTAVLVGLVLVWVLQEWLGWGFTGLVVPGYLASVLVIQPLTAGVMVVEAVATWLVLVALSDALPRWWPWSPLFGRDRFFLTLLASVGVRLAMEGAVFPFLADRLQLRVAAELHSMGLVVVPLLAYAIWRNGPVRAVPRVGVPLLLTWVVLRFVLLAHTNLSLGSFELTYEDLAMDFVGSPRAYMLLLAGAWLGSVTNLRYGWDFGGIIVPGLLALCWLEPERLGATIGESLLIAMALQLLLRLPALREMNLAGGRTLVLAVLVGYTLKFGLGHVLGAGWPGLRLRQLFGFGYLLPSLMALRMARSGDPFRTIIPSLATSLGGFLGGSALAWLLALALPTAPLLDVAPPADAPAADSLLLAAWRNEGPAPLDPGELLGSTEPVLVTAGDGFGALWLRPEGVPLLISARLGPPGMGQAALALAERTGARGVLLCGPVGAACDQARRDLGLRLPLLIVEPGPALGLEAGGRILDVLARPALESITGPLTVHRSEGVSVLSLPSQARFALASASRGVDAAPWEHPLTRPLHAVSRVRPGSDGLIRTGIIQPLLDWADDAPWAPDALRTAARSAHSVGAGLSADADRVSLVASDWRAVVRRGGQPIVIEVPFAEDDPNAAASALALAEDLDAVLVLLDDPPIWENRQRSTDRPAYSALLGALEALRPEGLRVLSLRGLRDLQDPGSEVVLAARGPLVGSHPPPPVGQELANRLASVGLGVSWYDGAPARLAFRDSSDPAKPATILATGEERQLTVYLSSPLRARLAPPDPGGPLFATLDASALPAWTLRARDLAQAAAPAPADPAAPAAPEDAAWAPWQAAALDLARTGGSAELRVLERESRRRGARLGLACDPLAGCRWLVALRCQAGRCSGVTRALGTGPTSPAAAPLDRLLLGDGVLHLVDLPEPEELPAPAAPAPAGAP